MMVVLSTYQTGIEDNELRNRIVEVSIEEQTDRADEARVEQVYLALGHVGDNELDGDLGPYHAERRYVQTHVLQVECGRLAGDRERQEQKQYERKDWKHDACALQLKRFSRLSDFFDE